MNRNVVQCFVIAACAASAMRISPLASAQFLPPDPPPPPAWLPIGPPAISSQTSLGSGYLLECVTCTTSTNGTICYTADSFGCGAAGTYSVAVGQRLSLRCQLTCADLEISSEFQHQITESISIDYDADECAICDIRRCYSNSEVEVRCCHWHSLYGGDESRCW